MTSFEGQEEGDWIFTRVGAQSRAVCVSSVGNNFAKSRDEVFEMVCLCACLGVRLPLSVLLPQPATCVE